MMVERLHLLNKLSYEQMSNLVEELDDEFRIQKEYCEKRLEELVQAMEDQIMLYDTGTSVLK